MSTAPELPPKLTRNQARLFRRLREERSVVCKAPSERRTPVEYRDAQTLVELEMASWLPDDKDPVRSEGFRTLRLPWLSTAEEVAAAFERGYQKAMEDVANWANRQTGGETNG